MSVPERPPGPPPKPGALPVEIEVYVEPDGSVVFADLAAGALPLADALSPPLPPREQPDDADPLG